jgi:hypothetical protein
MAPLRFKCPQCEAMFSRPYNRERHFNRVHNNVTLVHDCVYCGAVFNSGAKLRTHLETHTPTSRFVIYKSAFRRKCVIYRKTYAQNVATLEESFQQDKDEIFQLLKFECEKRKHNLKVSMIHHAEFAREVNYNLGNAGAENNSRIQICLRAPARLLTNDSEIHRFMLQNRAYIQDRIDDFLENGSGWTLDGITMTDLEMGNCASLNGACNQLSITFLKSLKVIKKGGKKKNCFAKAVSFHFLQNDNEKKLRKFIKLNINNVIPYPVAVKDIPKFEEANKHLDFKINVIFAEDEGIYPIYFSRNIAATHHITLILYKTIVDGKVVNHYAYVKDINKLLRKRYASTNTYEKAVRCLNCFTKFTSKNNKEEALKTHYELCLKNKPQAVKIPYEGEVIQFKKFQNKFKSYYIGFFDFESAHHKPKNSCDKCDLGEADICPHKTNLLAEQKPITVSYLIMDWSDNIVCKKTYTGDDCVEIFLDDLLTHEEDLLEKISGNVSMIFTRQDQEEYEQASKCHICGKVIGEDKVKDHCHITGKYLGAAHNVCNMLRQENKKIPMFCHNFTGYDGHFLMQKLGGDERITHLEALAYNTEKFRTIQVNSYIFLDSLSFLNASLNELMTDLLKNRNHNFAIVDQMHLYPKNSTHMKQLILRKGVYPYEFVSDIDKLRKCKRIPKKKYFHSILTNSDVTNEDYKHAKKVFKTFRCKNMIDYTELYCAMDVAILAEVVTQFRKLVLRKFKLDCW